MNTDQASMTALVSAFSRWYHHEHAVQPIYDDTLAGALLSPDEKRAIAAQMSGGISFFCPGFQGSPKDALRRIVDGQLSPSPLGRAAFARRALRTAVTLGTRQFILLGAGYDTFAYRQPEWARDLRIFEVDHPATAKDKQRRLAAAGIVPPANAVYLPLDVNKDDLFAALTVCGAFCAQTRSFCSLLGLVYYLPPQTLRAVLDALGRALPAGSAVAFDYPDEAAFTPQAGEHASRQEKLARGAGEAMQRGWAYREMEALLADCGWSIYEHLTPPQITAQFFTAHNLADPVHAMKAPANTNYCLAVKYAPAAPAQARL